MKQVLAKCLGIYPYVNTLTIPSMWAHSLYPVCEHTHSLYPVCEHTHYTSTVIWQFWSCLLIPTHLFCNCQFVCFQNACLDWDSRTLPTCLGNPPPQGGLPCLQGKILLWQLQFLCCERAEWWEVPSNPWGNLPTVGKTLQLWPTTCGKPINKRGTTYISNITACLWSTLQREGIDIPGQR